MKKNADKRRGGDYAFSVINNDDMICWTKGSTQQYLSQPTKLINRLGISELWAEGLLTKPASVNSNILGKYGIAAMAFSRRTSDFYHFVKTTTCTDIAVVVSGSISFHNDVSALKISAGNALVIPAGSSGHFRITSARASFYWFDVLKGCEIDRRVGRSACVKKMGCFKELVYVLDFYKEEIYNRNDARILETYAAAFYALFMRELSADCGMRRSKAFESLVARISKRPSEFESAAKSAAELGWTVYELDKASLSLFGAKFAKVVLAIRMKEASRLLAEGRLSCGRIAEKVGYGSVFSFSYAYKRYYGHSPKNA